MATSTVKLAILDDYQGVAKDHFLGVYPDRLDLTVFRDTLPPYSHPSTSEDERRKIVQRFQPFTIISTMRERTAFPRELLVQLPNLKLLLTTGLKNASIDTKAAKDLGITVCGTNGHGRSNSSKARNAATSLDSTTEQTWALILGLARNIAKDDAVVKNGGWETDLATGLKGKTLGLLGLGRLGCQTARIGHIGFGMNIIAWSSNLTQDKADEQARAWGLPVQDESGRKTFKAVSKAELFSSADVLSLHYVLSDRSRGIVSKKELDLMKPTALLVNTSRGPLIDEGALLEILQNGAIKGAALDVFDVEPLPIHSKWRTTDWGNDGTSKVLLSPHMGYVEERVIDDWYEETAENIERWFEGKELLKLIS